MRILYSLLPLLIAIAGCASSSKHNGDQQQTFANLVQLEKPGNTAHQPSNVYIDSVKQIKANNQPALLISGTFPDACTKLEDVSHSISNDSLHIQIKAWRNPKEMCAQVLTPFSFIYDKLTREELSSHSEVFINSTAYSY
ncbi:MAG: hypothetical protein PVI44_02975 [Balneolaceae bacterium]